MSNYRNYFDFNNDNSVDSVDYFQFQRRNNNDPFDTVDQHTFMIGLGARARNSPTVYVVAEITPRLAGYTPDANQMSFGIEKRAGGHLFQINFSNGFATTLGQIAQGARNYDDWFIGFNISRKFFR